jgi:hypothetical protein
MSYQPEYPAVFIPVGYDLKSRPHIRVTLSDHHDERDYLVLVLWTKTDAPPAKAARQVGSVRWHRREHS